MRFAVLFRRCAVAASLIVPLAAALAHEGEDHGAPAVQASAPAAPRATATSAAFELVAVARGGALTIYLDRYASNEPIADATIAVETPAGEARAVPGENQTFSLDAPWSVKPGRYELLFTVTAGGDVDVLPVALLVPEASAENARPATALAGAARMMRDAFGAATNVSAALALGGFVAGAVLATLFARARRKGGAAAALIGLALVALSWPALAHEGEDHGAPAYPAGDRAQRQSDGTLSVPKSTQRLLAIRTQIAAASTHRRTIELPGRIIPDPNASGYVQASAGGRVSAPEGGFPRLGTRVNKGDVLAYVTPPLQAIDVSDMRQRQGELDQQIAIVERRIARYDTLAQKGAVTQVQLDEARLELDGLRDRRVALDRARRQPEALEAPASGVVAEVSAVAGQMAQPNAVLFHIVDPARLWVEALSFDALTEAQNATVRIEGRALSLVYQGSGFAGRNQAVPVHFRIGSDTNGLRVGQFVTVLAATREEKQGIAVPRGSVVRSQGGTDVVFEHTAPETFTPRSVRIEPLDGEHVLVVTGLSPGARIVTQGAELLDQVR